MKKRGAIVAGFIAAAMGLGGAAANAAVTIDPNGAAPPVSAGPFGTFFTPFDVAALDWSQGNAIAVGAVTAIGNGVGSEFNLFYQAKLRGFDSTSGPVSNVVLGTGPGAVEWTVVAGFRERVVSTTGSSAEFELVTGPGVLNFLEIYYDDTPDANDLAGTGFSNGRLILTSNITEIGQSDFTVSGFTGAALDQFGTNNYPGLLTVNGSGNTTPMVTDITGYDPTFFGGDIASADLIVNLVLQNVSQALPFLTVDPSARFTLTAAGVGIGSSSADRATLAAGAGTVGAVNGASGPDVMFQVDSNSRFETASNVIPEPATAGLGLMGLTALALGLRRRRQA
jgi:uncharacterized protein (TIGR03382 family)